MNCSNCNTRNDAEARFCTNCGTDLQTTFESKTGNKTSDSFLLIFIGVAFIMAVAQFAIQKFVPNWYERPTKYIQGSLWILQNLTFLLIPLCIKDKSLKIVGIIITSILVLFWLYSNVDFMLK